MASSLSSFLLISIIFSIFFLKSHCIPHRYTSIFSFGDSLADTGNFLILGPRAFPVSARLPYGETFFQHPTGRCSDGRLVVDFIAEEFGLPLLPPYLAGGDFKKGANFAVAGATAINVSFFVERNITNLWTKDSLSVQLGWFKQLLPSLCTTKQGCDDYMSKSLFLVGEIGLNDYNLAFLNGKRVEEVQGYVRFVVKAIRSTVNSLIEQGAMEILVPGNIPMGCSTLYLTLFQSSNKADYDSFTGCLKGLNEFSEFHNAQLQEALQMLRQKHPHVEIIYADYYNALMQFYRSPYDFGFKEGGLSACCGGRGPYNFNISAICGLPGSEVCDNPSQYVNWDGIHLTEAAYRQLTNSLLKCPFTTPPFISPPN